MKIITPRQNFNLTIYKETKNPFSIFLAGTIDGGESIDWQSQVILDLYNFINESKDFDKDLTIFNPRRYIWPKESDKQEIEYQIKWEQEHLDEAKYIFMYLDEHSLSPISLLELGLYAKSHKLVVFCNSNFYRYDNVKLTCDKYNIALYDVKSIKNMSQNIFNIINESIK